MEYFKDNTGLSNLNSLPALLKHPLTSQYNLLSCKILFYYFYIKCKKVSLTNYIVADRRLSPARLDGCTDDGLITQTGLVLMVLRGILKQYNSSTHGSIKLAISLVLFESIWPEEEQMVVKIEC